MNKATVQILPRPVALGNFSELQSQFLLMLQNVMESFDRVPHSLALIKAFLGSLVLPQGKTVPVVDPSRYERVMSTRELFRQLSILWNCFSPDLLKMMCEECQCSSAMTAIEEFLMFRDTRGASLICKQKLPIDEANNKSNTTATAPLSPFHLACHTGPSDSLQSLHPSVFQCLDEHKHIDPSEIIRLSVQVNRPHLTLQDYDDVTTAVCSYFVIPRAALVYGGCSQDGRVVCWSVSASIQPYIQNCVSVRSLTRLMAEQKDSWCGCWKPAVSLSRDEGKEQIGYNEMIMTCLLWYRKWNYLRLLSMASQREFRFYCYRMFQ